MAKGRPDFFGTPVHFKQGVPKGVYGNTDCGGGDWVEIISATCKGTLMYANFFISDSDVMTSNWFRMILDNQTVFEYRLFDLFNRLHAAPTTYPIQMLYYDLDKPNISISFAGLYDFLTNIKWDYNNVTSPANVNVYYNMYYKKIE